MGWAFQFAPTGAFTLEANVIFSTYELALAYAKNNATAVVGKVISVVTGEDAGVYMIEAVGAENGRLKKVGSDIDLSNYVTKDQLTSIYTYKGSKATYEELPAEGNLVGDVWNVESEVVLGGELDSKKYLAGTNWVWNGSAWDALAGAIDLSGYVTKTEMNIAHEGITNSITELSGALDATNSSLSNKLDKVEGSSLITSEKLALIDTNAQDIAQLKPLSGRVADLEGLFEDSEGGSINLGGINQTISEHSSKLAALELNKADGSDLEALEVRVDGHDSRLVAIETLNTTQNERIDGLATRVENVEKYGESLTSLNNTVIGHSTEIDNIKSSISGLAVKSVKANERVLAADSEGALSTSIALDYDSENKKIQLKGIANAVVSELDASIFIKDGMLSSATFEEATKEIVLTWNTDAGKAEAMRIPVGSLVDVYTAGSGLSVAGNQFSVKVDPSANNKLSIGENGLMVDISADVTAINASVDSKIQTAFSWNLVE